MSAKIKELHSDVMVKALTMQIKRFISAHELSAGKDESGTGAALVLHQARVLNTILAIGNIPTQQNYASVVAKCKSLLQTPGGLDPQTANQIRQFLIIISFPMRMAEAQLELERKPIPRRIEGIISSNWPTSAEEMLKETMAAEKETPATGSKQEHFFAGTMGRTEAEDVLRSRINSTFLLRESESQAGAYTISIRDADQVFHFRVGMLEGGQVFIDPQQPFDNFEGLVLFLQGQDSIGGYPARLRVPFRLPESKLDYPTSPTAAAPPARPYSAGDSRRRPPADNSDFKNKMRTTLAFDKDVSMLQHQRAVSAAKGSVMLLYARSHGPDDDGFTEKKVSWIKHHLTLQGWRVWIEADHVPDQLGSTVAQQIVLSAVEMSNAVIACVSRGFLSDGSYAASALEHARLQKRLANRVFTIRLRDTPKETAGGILGLHMRKEKYYDQRFLMNSYWVKQLYKEGAGQEPDAAITRRVVGALSCDFISLREEEGAESVFAEPEKVVANVPDLFQLTVLSESSETVAKAATGSVVLSYDWGPRVGASFPVQDLVVRFAGLLEQNGYSVLLDTIHTDGDIDDIMEIAIKRSAVVLACVSEDYMRAGSSSEKEWQLANTTKELGESLFVVNLHKPGSGSRINGGQRHSDHYIFTSTDEACRFDLSTCVNGQTDVTPHAIAQLSQLFKALDARGVRQHYPAGHCYSPVSLPARPGRRSRPRVQASASQLTASGQGEELSDLPYYIGAQSAVLCRSMLGSRARANEFVVRKLKPRSQDCKVFAVMVFLGKEKGIYERLVLLERGKYRFADTQPGEPTGFDSMPDAIARIPEAKKIARNVVDMLYQHSHDLEI